MSTLSLRSHIAGRFWNAVAPAGTTATQRRNFLHVQLDAVGVGVAVAADAFLPVFLTRSGASNFQIGLLTAMPALGGLFLSMAAGHFLQGRRNIVPWYSSMRLLALSAYTLTGIIPFLVPGPYVVPAALGVWMAATVPQTLLNVSFNVVMNAVAGPKNRYTLMSRRWGLIALAKAAMAMAAGQTLFLLPFPLNYQVMFMALSLGGVASFFISNRIIVPDADPAVRAVGLPIRQRFRTYLQMVRGERDFTTFVTTRFLFVLGQTLATPLFPILYVRELHASDAWIGIIGSVQTAVTLVGYYFWARQQRRRGARFVLLSTTMALALYPALVAVTRRVELVAFWAALSGIFQSGLNLVFFDELMRTIPAGYSPIFVSLAHTLNNLSAVAAPLIGTVLADQIGLRGGLAVSAGLCILGFGLFAWRRGSNTGKRTA